MAGWNHRASEGPHRLTRTLEYAQLLRGRPITDAELAKVTQSDNNPPSQAGQGSGQELLFPGRRVWYSQLSHVLVHSRVACYSFLRLLDNTP